MGKRRKRRIYTCSDKILCGLGRMYAGGGAKVTLEKACGMTSLERPCTTSANWG